MPDVAELHEVVKEYGDVTALDGVSVSLPAGRVTALLGPNGAGKATAVKVLLGLTRPTRGSALLFGLDPGDTVARRRLGVSCATV